MKKIKICTPVIGETLKKFLKNLDQVQEISSIVELRVDKIKNLSVKDLVLVRKRTKKEAILTSRRKDIILKSLNLGFDFIDIDVSMINDLKLSRFKQSKIILSFHDDEKTPGIQELTVLVHHMREYNIEVIKIATMVNDDQDIKNLLQILLNKKKNEKIIIIGMGKKGQIIRILGPLLGSFLTFASTKFGATAPGQIDIDKMKNIYKLLNYS
ncbi:3-dehydroquinate dehydratase [Candidatus Roizmanbacteria bacterium]|nr:3-dehydroquinate dehydratase [Candidatus Roizmanbacteria bacterium]